MAWLKVKVEGGLKESDPSLWVGWEKNTVVAWAHTG